MWQKFLSIPDKLVTAVIVNIKDKEEDIKILNNWEHHFQGYFMDRKIFPAQPYIVTKDPKTGIHILWKGI